MKKGVGEMKRINFLHLLQQKFASIVEQVEQHRTKQRENGKELGLIFIGIVWSLM